MSLNKIDYIEFYVFNAFQAANFYKSVLGFDIIAYGGPETGLNEKISYIVKQETMKLVISSAIDTTSSILQPSVFLFILPNITTFILVLLILRKVSL